MNNEELFALSEAWLDAKEAERMAVEARRDIEDKIADMLGIDESMEGTFNAKTNTGHVIKVTGRLNRKVDADKAAELAAEHGMTEHLDTLFRWKPEINLTAWRKTSPEITAVMAHAITITPSRPSFSISLEV